MAAEFTRCRHPELGETVLPVDALPHMPEWVAFGEPSTDPAALRIQAEAEAEAAAEETTDTDSRPADETQPAKATKTTRKRDAGSGATTEEQ